MTTRSWKLIAAITTTLALLLVPASVTAISQLSDLQRFDDVPSTDWAYNDVQWLAAVGLTNGCGDGTIFCPDDGLTRRQMAAFTNRVNEKLIPFTIGIVNETSTLITTNTNMGQVSFTAEEISLVTLTAVARGNYAADGGTSGYSDLSVWAQIDNSECLLPGISAIGTQSLAPEGVEPFAGTAAIGDMVQIAAGPHTVSLCASASSGDAARVYRATLTGTVSANPAGNLSASSLSASSVSPTEGR